MVEWVEIQGIRSTVLDRKGSNGGYAIDVDDLSIEDLKKIIQCLKGELPGPVRPGETLKREGILGRVDVLLKSRMPVKRFCTHSGGGDSVLLFGKKGEPLLLHPVWVELQGRAAPA